MHSDNYSLSESFSFLSLSLTPSLVHTDKEFSQVIHSAATMHQALLNNIYCSVHIQVSQNQHVTLCDVLNTVGNKTGIVYLTYVHNFIYDAMYTCTQNIITTI